MNDVEKKLLLAIIFFAFSTLFLAAQEKEKSVGRFDKISQLTECLQNSEKNNILFPQEKVYLHFDNSSYYLGEHIWFKAYVTQAANNRLSNVSRTLYVELLNREGLLVVRKKYPIRNGLAQGDFLLKDSCEAGFYEVRAYTRWMRNWDEDCVFSRVFPIFNKPLSNGEWLPTMDFREKVKPINRRPDTTGDDTINVYFFPESGALIEGIPTQVAFKAIDANGNAVSLKNAALYEKGNDKPLVSLHSFHNGMGLFVLLPEQEKHYEVRVCIGNDVKNFALPETTKSGYRMQVNNLFPDRIHVNIASNGMPSDTLGVALSLRGKVYAWKWVYLSDSIETSFLFSKSGIPKGVAELTLFDAFGKIQAERKVFIGLDGSADSSQIHITFDKDSVHTESCHFSSIYFKLTRSDGKPIPHTSFSVSITDAKTDIPLLLNETACINLLLSSDLKGCIEHPEYYFENDDKRHQYALDLLMRIQGWRRYKWSPRVFVPRFTPEYGIAFDGEVTHTLSHKSYSGITVTCYGFGTQKLAKGLQYGESQTDSLGRFGFLFDFEGPLKMTFTTLKDKKKVETNLRFYRDFYPVPRELEGWEQPLSFKFRHFNLDDRVDSLLYQNNEVEILKSVEVKAKRKFFLPTTPRENIVLDVPLCIDELRDRGIEISTIAQLFKYYDPLFLCTDEFYNYFHPVREMIMRHDGKYMKMVLNEYLLRKTYSLKEPDLLNVKELAAPKGMSFDDLLAIRSNADWWYEAISEGDSTNADNLLGAIRKIVIATGPIGEVKDSKAWDYGYKNGESLFFITLFPHAEKRKEAYGQRITTIYGYNAMDAFYSPAYINPSTEVYDGRRTLMWMPDVYTDAQGIGQVDFYNSPTCRQIFIDAECVTRDGCIGSYRQLIGE